jgi:5-oxoprolinase (ATP-hydrolysing)
MSEAVRFQVRYYGPGGPGAAEGLREGDVLLSNHPQLAGGSHLPDITVITPVFDRGQIVFFVARCAARCAPPPLLRSCHHLAACPTMYATTTKAPLTQHTLPHTSACSRGHHADVGGISPGSMPPASKRLVEEGAAIVSFKIVRDGAFQVLPAAASCLSLYNTPPPHASSLCLIHAHADTQ